MYECFVRNLWTEMGGRSYFMMSSLLCVVSPREGFISCVINYNSYSSFYGSEDLFSAFRDEQLHMHSLHDRENHEGKIILKSLVYIFRSVHAYIDLFLVFVKPPLKNKREKQTIEWPIFCFFLASLQNANNNYMPLLLLQTTSGAQELT